MALILILILLHQVERVRDELRTAGITPLEEYLPDSPDTIGNCALDINSVQRVTEVWSIDYTHYPTTCELILCQHDRSAQMGITGRQPVMPIQSENSIISFTTYCTLAKVLRTSCESSIKRRHLRRLKINLPRYLFHKGDGQRLSIMLYLKEGTSVRYIKK